MIVNEATKLSLQRRANLFHRHALRGGFTVEKILQRTKIDRWFLKQDRFGVRPADFFRKDSWFGCGDRNPQKCMALDPGHVPSKLQLGIA
jgi:hypothetical protein